MISVSRLTKYYGDHAAVSDVSFTVNDGEVVGLLGLNGAGKSTILKILSGLLPPTAGGVTIGGVDLVRDPEKARARVGFLPERPPLYSEMTVRAFLSFVARIKGFRGPLAEAVERAMQAADLQDVGDQVIGTLSNGYQRRVGIAQAVVHSPALILLDEPTSGLDPKQMVHMRELLLRLRGSNTVMVSSHVLSEIHQVCDRILVLKEGRIAAEGTEAELAGLVNNAITVRLEVRGAASALQSVLSGTGGVASHSIGSERDGVTVATVELASDTREELAAAVVAAGLGLRSLERVQMELETIFLQLTGRENAAAVEAA